MTTSYLQMTTMISCPHHPLVSARRPMIVKRRRLLILHHLHPVHCLSGRSYGTNAGMSIRDEGEVESRDIEYMRIICIFISVFKCSRTSGTHFIIEFYYYRATHSEHHTCLINSTFSFSFPFPFLPWTLYGPHDASLDRPLATSLLFHVSPAVGW